MNATARANTPRTRTNASAIRSRESSSRDSLNAPPPPSLSLLSPFLGFSAPSFGFSAFSLLTSGVAGCLSGGSSERRCSQSCPIRKCLPNEDRSRPTRLVPETTAFNCRGLVPRRRPVISRDQRSCTTDIAATLRKKVTAALTAVALVVGFLVVHFSDEVARAAPLTDEIARPIKR